MAAQKKDLTDKIVDVFRQHWIECEPSKTDFDCHLPPDAEVLNLLTNNLAEASIKMLRSFLKQRFNVVAAIVQLCRWWEIAGLVDPKPATTHTETARRLHQGGFLYLSDQVRPVPGREGVFAVNRGDGQVALVDMTRTNPHCNVPHCQRLPGCLL